MKKLYVSGSDKFRGSSFLHVFTDRDPIVPGLSYTFLEYGCGTFIKNALCVSVEVKRLSDLSESVAFLDLNCDLDIYIEILKKRGIKDHQWLYIGVFSLISNSKKHYDYARIHH